MSVYESDEHALSAVAIGFYQTYGVSDHHAVAQHLRKIGAGLSPAEAAELPSRLRRILARYPDEESFERAFIRAGADNWPTGARMRMEFEAWVSELGG